MAPLTTQTAVADGVVVLTLAGELDLGGATVFERALESALATNSPTVVVLDLRDVEFMDSSGLRVLAMADADAREEGWRLVVVRGRPLVQRVFEITRMVDRLAFVDDPSEVKP